jgi:two-component system sensor kinase FixL
MHRDTPDSSLLALIIETAPDAIITADEHGNILSFSPAAERIFGHLEKEVIGRNLTMLMPEPFRAEHDGYMERYLDTGEKHIIGIGREVRALRKNGEIFVAELAVGELRHGEHRIFTGFIRDASERARVETRARDLQIRLDRVARIQTLGELSSALAHEINQPLSAIANFATAIRQALGRPDPDLDTVRRHAGHIADEAMRAGEITRRMRKLVERGRADIRPEDINEIIEEAVRVGRMAYSIDGPQIHLELGRNLPKVMADRIQIQQVLLNLLRNALEAIVTDLQEITITSRGQKNTDSIVLRANTTADEVIVSIQDTGPGIAAEVMDTLFEPLVRAKPTGTGIGLAVCRTIIQAHGGRIWAENGEKGAVFSFTLPVASKDQPA